MIVVPTEKQFDWQHAPVVLFGIVLLNVLVFFLYQSGDTEKYYRALTPYIETGYMDGEWVLYQNFLEEAGETEQLEELQEYAQDNQREMLAFHILSDREFYQYLVSNAEQELAPGLYPQWLATRQEMQRTFDSVSATAFGLVANDLNPLHLLTHQFLHGDTMHLLGNMFFLVVCGFAVEAAIGHWRFLAFYLISGVAAGLAQAASDWHSNVPLVGASGAISGVMAMYLAVFQLRKIEFFYWIFFLVGYFRAPALVILPFYIGKEIFSYYSAPESNIAFLAHAGGFVAGGVLVGVSLLLDKKTINTEYLDSDQSAVDEYRLALAGIYRAIEKYQFKEAYQRLNEAVKSQGETFQLALIRYNLLKIHKGKSFPASVLKLWQQTKLMPGEIARVESIWREHPELHSHLKPEPASLLGLQFATENTQDSAEQIFDRLSQAGHASQNTYLLAQKLSALFASQGRKKKQAKCDAYITRMIKEGHNGAL